MAAPFFYFGCNQISFFSFARKQKLIVVSKKVGSQCLKSQKKWLAMKSKGWSKINSGVKFNFLASHQLYNSHIKHKKRWTSKNSRKYMTNSQPEIKFLQFSQVKLMSSLFLLLLVCHLRLSQRKDDTAEG